MWSSCRKHLTPFVWKQDFTFGKKIPVQLISFQGEEESERKNVWFEEYLSVSTKHL